MYNKDDKAVFLHSQGESAFTLHYIQDLDQILVGF